MSEEKHIHYSAADIGRYHKGLMTAKERHALEKAALDDPFLADAIEGYAALPTDAEADVTLLNKRLDERTGKVVSIKKKTFIWLRIAALVILIVGAGVLAYNYLFQNNKKDVATIGNKETVAKKDTTANSTSIADTVKNPVAATENKTFERAGQKEHIPQKTKEYKEAASDNSETSTSRKPSDAAIEKNEIAAKKRDTAQRFFNTESAAANTKPISQDDTPLMKDKNEETRLKAKSLSQTAAARGITAQNSQTHIFRGQVLDQNNSPLPFANVTILPDNIGTYTDAKGSFSLISPDSTINVQVRSVGFENKTTTLQTGATYNSIVLDQDTKNIPSTVISNRNINSERKRVDNNMTLEEPEPADGWYNYDTYIANNIKISDEIKMKTNPSSEVELSFDVNEFGEPVNIKVEKSVCRECDAEAIRLLKEGPKWKKNKKNRRAKVSVTFQ